MKKVLIITYYWPPSGGAGVQRWLKFVKYLREFNIEPVIYTPEGGEMPSIDASLEKDVPEGVEVVKQPIWEPYNAYKKLLGQKKDEKINTGFLTENKKPSKMENFSVWVRGNFFIPDARKFWVKPSVKFLKKYLQENPVDAIITTGPPHSMHLIGLQLKRNLGVKWLADFRDPWTNIDFYKDLKLSKRSDKKHRRLEREVLQEADVIVSIGKTMGEELIDLGATKMEVITNGFDPSDFKTGNIELDQKFSIAHIGSMTKTRNPESLWMVLSKLVQESELFKNRLEIKLVGKVDYHVMEAIRAHGLDNYVNKIDYLPHDQVMSELQKTRLLLLMVNNTPNAKGIVTGKIFEYLAANRPILAIGPEDGDLAEILNSTERGSVFHYSNTEDLEEFLRVQISIEEHRFNPESIEKYSRKALTQKLSEVILNDLLGN